MTRNDTANTENLLKQIDSVFENGARLLVAFSGGVDSSVLLHALVSLRSTSRIDIVLRAVYVHHGLSQNADAWALHCKAQCEQWGYRWRWFEWASPRQAPA